MSQCPNPFKTWDFPGVFKEDFEGVFKRVFKGDLEVDMDWEIKEDSKGDLLSRSGKVKVWFRLQLKFNS